MAAWLEYGADLVMGGEEPLRLAGGLEPAHNFLSSSRRPVTTLNPVVKALMGLVVCIGGLMGNRLDVAPQFVCHDDLWLTKCAINRAMKRLAAFALPCVCTRISSVSPLASTARQSQCFSR